MPKFYELLDSLTDEDGIPADFIEGARLAYDEDIAELGTSHESAIAELNNTNTSAIEALTATHAAELESVRNERFEAAQDDTGDDDALPDSYGEDEDLSLDNYWEKAD